MGVARLEDHVNEVRIRGRVSGSPRPRCLPSGDEIVHVRVVVPRPVRARAGSSPGAGRVDTIECVAWASRPRSSVTRLADGDHVLVSGSLRRRFWRAGASVVSKVEVEVTRVRRVPAPSQEPALKDRRRRQASGA